MFPLAKNQLQVSLDVLNNNIPINEREGKMAQVKLERDTAKDIEGAIQLLSRKRKPITLMQPGDKK